jgi:hypothetical protein
MNRVDHIIKYLSGDLSRKETRLFEEELAGDESFQEEFHRVSEAWKLIGEQLRQLDEESFRSRLGEVMDHTPASPTPGKPVRRPVWFYLVPAAASIILVMILFLRNEGDQDYFARFYQPAADPVLQSLMEETRGNGRSAREAYHRGDLDQAYEITEEILGEDPGDRGILLLHLIVSIELANPGKGLEKVSGISINLQQPVDQAITWYSALAQLQSGLSEDAVITLEMLSTVQGTYHRDAHKLKKLLKK